MLNHTGNTSASVVTWSFYGFQKDTYTVKCHPHTVCFPNLSDKQNETSHTKPRNAGIKGKKEAERWATCSLEHISSNYLFCASHGPQFIRTITSATWMLCPLFTGKPWRKLQGPQYQKLVLELQTLGQLLLGKSLIEQPLCFQSTCHSDDTLPGDGCCPAVVTDKQAAPGNPLLWQILTHNVATIFLDTIKRDLKCFNFLFSTLQPCGKKKRT